MKFLTDENVDIRVVNGLLNAGYDIFDIKKEGLQGSKDTDLLDLAHKQKRIIITYDKDFENYFYLKNVKTYGIILLKFKNKSPDNILNLLIIY